MALDVFHFSFLVAGLYTHYLLASHRSVINNGQFNLLQHVSICTSRLCRHNTSCIFNKARVVCNYTRLSSNNSTGRKILFQSNNFCKWGLECYNNDHTKLTNISLLSLHYIKRNVGRDKQDIFVPSVRGRENHGLEAK